MTSASPAPLPRWLSDSVSRAGFPDEQGREFEPSLELDVTLVGPLDVVRHLDGTVSFSGSGIEGCRYPDGTTQTRPATSEDPCCHAETLDACECITEAVDPHVRAGVIEQLNSR